MRSTHTTWAVSVLLLAAGCSNLTEQQRGWLEDGRSAQDTGQHTRAAEKFTLFLSQVDRGPEQAQALYLRGKSYALAGDRDRAIADLRRCAQLDADHESTWRALVLLGTIYFEELGDWPAARQAYAAAAARMPDEAKRDLVIFRLSLCCERSAMWREALAWQEELTKRYPQSPLLPDAQRRVALRADHFAVQCGAFGEQRNAESLLDSLRRRGFDPFLRREPRGNTYMYVVLVGKYQRYDDALRQLGSMRQVVPGAVIWP
ncbi:MAG TPA: SPOR domain-containing protein [Phycisphaerae bacterium]|nr:SPOR domain-containing protein [Phycisphaerae bacterium]